MVKYTLNSPHQRSKGQTLAEFALTLPILLLLLFGIVEFGRLFQSWVTLQNAARTAVRYASTGQYKEDRYPIDSLIICEPNPAGQASIGGIETISLDRGRGYLPVAVEVFEPPTIGSIDPENLYATWYGDPSGCAPGPNSDQNRKDMLRLPSIYEEARRGAAGLLIEDSRVIPNIDSLQNYLYSSFQRPSPDIDDLDWFDVVVCSSRDKLWSDDLTQIYDVDTGAPTLNPADNSRFQLVLDDPDYAPAACVLREGPVDEQLTNIPNNPLVPWMDAGSPGDRVTVVITYNHRLITPIGLANRITLQAQRSAINEAFRVSNAPTGPVPPPLPTSTEAPTLTPDVVETATDIPDTDTPVPIIPTETAAPATNTPAVFSCDNLDAFFRSAPFNGSRVYIEFANFNAEPAYLLESTFVWDNSAAATDFPNMTLRSMSLDSEVYWFGEDNTSPTTASTEGTLLYDPDSRDHFIFVPTGGGKIPWQGQFLNAPSNMYDYFDIYDFAGTKFVFDNPDSDTDCEVEVYLPPVPTSTPTPEGYQSPTPSLTPDCASLTLRIEFVSLDIAGDVTLRIINDGPKNAPFTGFEILWPPMSGVGLDRVVFGGKNALDTPEVGGTGVIMWDSPFGGGDTTNNTSSTEQNFLTEVTVPAFSSTLLHLDFVGVGGKLPISPSDLNGSRFDIWCGERNVGFGGVGVNSDDDGSIFIAEVGTPVPTDQPPPTWTPLAATFTPTNTPKPILATSTNTPPPTVETNTPTPIPATEVPPTPVPTDGWGGGSSD